MKHPWNPFIIYNTCFFLKQQVIQPKNEFQIPSIKKVCNFDGSTESIGVSPFQEMKCHQKTQTFI